MVSKTSLGPLPLTLLLKIGYCVGLLKNCEIGRRLYGASDLELLGLKKVTEILPFSMLGLP